MQSPSEKGVGAADRGSVMLLNNLSVQFSFASPPGNFGNLSYA